MFLTIAAGLGAAAQVAGMYETTLAQQAAMEQINLQEKQKQLQLTQKKTSIYDQTEKVLKRQQAQASTRGISMDSPSFNAIQRDTVNVSSKELQNVNIEQDFGKYAADAERENVRRSTHAKLFGDTVSLTQSFATMQNAYKEWV